MAGGGRGAPLFRDLQIHQTLANVALLMVEMMDGAKYRKGHYSPVTFYCATALFEADGQFGRSATMVTLMHTTGFLTTLSAVVLLMRFI